MAVSFCLTKTDQLYNNRALKKRIVYLIELFRMLKFADAPRAKSSIPSR